MPRNKESRSPRQEREAAGLPGAAEGGRRVLLVRLCGVAFLQAASAAALAFGVAKTSRAFLGGDPIEPWVIAMFLAAVPLVGALRSIERIEAERLGQSYVLALRKTLVQRVLRTPSQAVVGSAHGAMLLRFTGDMTAFRLWASRGLARAIVGGATVVAGAAMMTWLDPAIGLAFIAGSAASILLAYLLAGPLSRKAREARGARVRLARIYGETLASLGGYQTFSRGRQASRRIMRRADDVRVKSVAQARAAGAIQGVAEASAVGLPVLALIAAAMFGADPSAAIAGMTAASMLSSRLRDLGRTPEYYANAQVAKERLLSSLARLPTTRTTARETPRPADGRLIIRGLSVPPALRNVRLGAAAGDRVALTGDTGTGKSVLLAAIAGLAPVSAGSIWLDGRPCSRLRPGMIGKEIVLVGEAAPIVAGSLRHNLGLAGAEADDAEIDLVVENCGLSDLVKRQARIAALGRNISAGERMRIMLARALLARPKVLLVDEWDAGMDTTSRAIFTRLQSTFGGILIWATHDPAFIEGADRVWHVGDGGVVEMTRGPRRTYNSIRPVG